MSSQLRKQALVKLWPTTALRLNHYRTRHVVSPDRGAARVVIAIRRIVEIAGVGGEDRAADPPFGSVVSSSVLKSVTLLMLVLCRLPFE